MGACNRSTRAPAPRERLGFRYVGEFTVERRGETLGSYDMILS